MNRGTNYEPARLRSFWGEQNLKSHGVPRLIGGACRRMAAHVQRLLRLTLKAGCKAGSPRDGRADRGKIQKSKIAKFEISKSANRKNENLKTFIAIFSTRAIAKLFAAKSYSCSQDQRRDFDLFATSLLPRGQEEPDAGENVQ